MGNKQSQSNKLPRFKAENWQMLEARRSPKVEYGFYHIYKNKITGEQIEQYSMRFTDEREYRKYIQFFQWRQREDNIVNTKFMNVEESNQFCNANHAALIYLEHIPIRLTNIEDIPYPQNLYVLFSVLDGFQKLFAFVGYFLVQQDFVCIDKDGKVKVWFNSDLSRSHTMETSSSQEMNNVNTSLHYQEQMVADIIQMVQRNTSDQIEASMSFSQYLQRVYKGKKVTFRQGKQEIINYTKENQSHIPNYFQSIMFLIEEQPRSEQEEHTNRQQIEDRARQQEQKIFTQNRQNRGGQRGQRRSYHENYNQNAMGHQENIVLASLPHQSEIVQRHPDHREELVRQKDYAAPKPLQAQSTIVQRPLVANQYFPAQRGRIERGNQNIKFNYQAPGVETAKFIPPNSHPVAPGRTASFVSQNQNPVPPVIHSILRSNGINQQIKKPDIQSTVKQAESERCFEVKVENKGVENVNVKKDKLFYSDTTVTYELDEEITSDILKYFGKPQL